MYVSVNCSCKSNNFILLEQNRVVRFFVTCISILYSVYLWNDNSVMLARISIKSKYWWASHFHECGVFALHNRIMNQTFSSFENLQLWEQKIIFIQQKIGKKNLNNLSRFMNVQVFQSHLRVHGWRDWMPIALESPVCMARKFSSSSPLMQLCFWCNATHGLKLVPFSWRRSLNQNYLWTGSLLS